MAFQTPIKGSDALPVLDLALQQFTVIHACLYGSRIIGGDVHAFSSCRSLAVGKVGPVEHALFELSAVFREVDLVLIRIEQLLDRRIDRATGCLSKRG